MKNNLIYTLDFGSSKATCMAVMRVGDEFVIKAMGETAYNGFDSENWYEPDSIPGVVDSVVNQVKEKTGTNIKEIFVGVPGAFSAVATSEASKTFLSKKKIDNDDVKEIIAKANIFDNSNMVNLGGSAVYYIIDGAIKTTSPVGTVGNKLTGLVSYSFMKKPFATSVTKSLTRLGVKNVHFVCTPAAEANFVSRNLLTDYAIVIDVGHITTNVMLACSGSLIFSKTFALGSGYLAADLMQVCNCKFETASRLLTKVNLNLEFQDGDAYSIDGQNISAVRANDVLNARIGQIADYIKRSFADCDKEIPQNTPIILTGGGLTYLKGAPECLANNLGKSIKVFAGDPQLHRNEHVSSYGIAMYAVNESKPRGLFRFL